MAGDRARGQDPHFLPPGDPGPAGEGRRGDANLFPIYPDRSRSPLLPKPEANMRSLPARLRIPLAALLLPILLLWSPAPASSLQTVTLDEGAFRVMVGGSEVGTETFFVRRSGEGAAGQTIAYGEVSLELPDGPLRLEPAVQASGSEMGVSAYQVRVVGGQQSGESRFERESNRFRMTMQTEMGERQREFRADAATVFLDSHVAHQYWFIGKRIADGQRQIPVIAPREGAQFTLTVDDAESDPVTIDGNQVPANRYRLTGQGGERMVWLDDEGRVLRVRIADLDYEAIRTARP
ncbi:MAG: hypothetical protein EA352_09010 [Gemmatimonadales bacterium]|nr:MAG: hypothetical protein EA352_09010 [Gemmatimonadales bacterium]